MAKPPRPWIANDFYELSTPLPSPMMVGGYRLYAAKATCRKCSKWHTQALRIHLVHTDLVTGAVFPKPVPSEEKLATSFMVKTCDNSVGCWRTCQPWKHLKVCQTPAMRLLLAHKPALCGCKQETSCTCPPRCGNLKIWPCRCGRMFGRKTGQHEVGCPAAVDKGANCECREFGQHKDGCSVGLFKRVSSFEVEYMRSQMTIAAKRPR